MRQLRAATKGKVAPRELARAFDAQDYAAMQSARRAIDAVAAGDTPRKADMGAVEKFVG
jgi:DNA-binding transcriptional regulator YdaS (Cro superfamily)